MGRLQPGASLEQARAAAALVMARMMKDYGRHAPAGRLDRGDPRIDEPASALCGQLHAAGCLRADDPGAAGAGDYGGECGQSALCAPADREREVAIRGALGATRWRLLRQLLAESTLLALAAGVSARWLPCRHTHAQQDDRCRRHGAPGQHRYGLALVCLHLCCIVVAGILAGLLPAWKATRLEILPLLKNAPAITRIRHRLRSLLVIAQVAFSCVVLICAGLAVRSVQKLVAGQSRLSTGPHLPRLGRSYIATLQR